MAEATPQTIGMTRGQAAIRFGLALPLFAVSPLVLQYTKQALEVPLFVTSVWAPSNPHAELQVWALTLAPNLLAGAGLGLLGWIYSLIVGWPLGSLAQRPASKWEIPKCIAGGLIGGACALGLLWWDQGIPDGMAYAAVVSVPSPLVPPMMAAAGAIVAVGEEVYFRGILFRLSRVFLPALPAGALNLALFAGVHTWAYGSVAMMVSIAFLGGICIHLVESRRCLISAAVFHAAVNVSFVGLLNLPLYIH